MANFEIPINWRTRDCLVNGRPGYFHCIVEFSDGVERVEPYKVKFVLVENQQE